VAVVRRGAAGGRARGTRVTEKRRAGAEVAAVNDHRIAALQQAAELVVAGVAAHRVIRGGGGGDQGADAVLQVNLHAVDAIAGQVAAVLDAVGVGVVPHKIANGQRAVIVVRVAGGD